MYSIEKYKILTLKYGPYASWAVWDCKNEKDTSIINQNFDQLHSRFILLGLNISSPLTDNLWSNFHGGKHDRKLKYACNDNKLSGSYITDIFKNIPVSQSNKLESLLTDEIIKKNVILFNQEMRDIKINNETQFIIFGAKARHYFNKYFKQEYKNRIIYYCHYSYYGFTDKKWVNGFWEKLNIDQDFDLTIKNHLVWRDDF